MQIYIENIAKDELRSGFIVSSSMKRVWNAQLNILHEFDRICKKHGLTYYFYAGSLLGAARHSGYIPWDNDLDLCMLRPDYAKLTAIIQDEMGEDFYFENYHNQKNKIYHSQFFLKGTLASFPGFPLEYLNSLYIDIFPLDFSAWNNPSLSPDEQIIATKSNNLALYCYGRKAEIDASVFMPAEIDYLNRLDLIELMQLYENYLLGHFTIGTDLALHAWQAGAKPEKKSTFTFRRHFFDQMTYLPFETLQVPVVKDYDAMLQCHFGDWHTPVKGSSYHEGAVMSADIDCRELESYIRGKQG